MTKYNKSYLKYSGSKYRILNHLLPILEKHRQPVFVEPFIGAANVSLNFDAEKYIWNDLNNDLIVSHSVVAGQKYGKKESNRGLVDRYIVFCEHYFERGFEKYYDIRADFNMYKPHLVSASRVKNSAIFQYLNKHGFNGLMRYNKSGKYNVPIGTVAKNPKKVPYEQIETFYERFSGDKVRMYNQSYPTFFEFGIEREEKALVYCDPPYVAAGATDFNYTADGFSYEDHVLLRDLSKDSKHTCILSNHWNDITKELYKDADEVYTFPVQRTISCKGDERKQVEECVVVYKGIAENA